MICYSFWIFYIVFLAFLVASSLMLIGCTTERTYTFFGYGLDPINTCPKFLYFPKVFFNVKSEERSFVLVCLDSSRTIHWPALLHDRIYAHQGPQLINWFFGFFLHKKSILEIFFCISILSLSIIVTKNLHLWFIP